MMKIIICMKIMNKLYIVFILILLAACKDEISPIRADRTLPFAPDAKATISSFVDTVQYLKLENVEEAFISRHFSRRQNLYRRFEDTQGCRLRYKWHFSICLG